jgi:hypothetical protein
LHGGYSVINHDRLAEKARAHDPRQVFFRAMQVCRTYEEYLARVGLLDVEVESYHAGPINGRMEILYARRSGWIEDAAP